MPPQNKQSKLFAKYGAKGDQAVRNHADDEVDYGFIKVPPGITNGVAKLTKAYFDTYKTGNNLGEYYFRMEGVILEPESVMTKSGEVRTAGLHTALMVPCCETKNSKNEITTQEENLATVLNEMKKLAGPEFVAGAGIADLEDLAGSLQEAGPYFRFSTSQSAPTPQYPDPRVWENWHGAKGMEDYVPPEEEATEDSSEPPPPSRHTSRKAAPAPTPTPTRATRPAASVKAPPPSPAKRPAPPTPSPAPSKAKGKPAPAPEPEPEPGYTYQVMELVQAAEGEDGDAQAQLSQMAAALGLEEEANAAGSWAEVGDLIMSASEQEQGEEAAEEEEEADDTQEEAEWAGPALEEVYPYKPTDPRTKKKLKAVDCEVVSVDKKAKTVSLKNLDNPKQVWTKVSWDDLVQD